VRQSSSTAAVIRSSPKAFDATAPWARVQNTHWFREETKAAKSSRSPTLQGDGPRITSSVTSDIAIPKNSSLYPRVFKMSGGSRPPTRRISAKKARTAGP